MHHRHADAATPDRDRWPRAAAAMGAVVATWALAVAAAPARAQEPGTLAAAATVVTPGQFDALLKPFASLTFDTEVKSLGLFSSLGNAVFKPEGNGPFPTVLMVHSCGGVGTPALRERAKELLDAGYLILMLDSFGPRQQQNCRNGVVRTPVVWRDALDALAHLRTQPAVDRERIYLVGFSLGSFTAAALASPQIRAAFRSENRFRALVGWYGSCGFPASSVQRASHFLRADTDSPLLLLMAEGDRESPIQPFCHPLLDDLKAAGKPVEWHVYPPPVTHAWDARSGYTFVTHWGDTAVNQFNADATADAMKRTLQFLQRQH